MPLTRILATGPLAPAVDPQAVEEAGWLAGDAIAGIRG
jgi:hypothetical protein